MHWLDHFEFTQPPFSKSIGDADLWLTPAKIEITDELEDAVRDRSSVVVLVGESGEGKSCVTRALRHRLQDDDVRLTYCHNATLGRRDFYRLANDNYNSPPTTTTAPHPNCA